MSEFTDDDVAAAARMLESCGVRIRQEYVARVVLAAVAPAIAGRALREAAGEIEAVSNGHDRWIAEWLRLRARAEGVESNG